MTKYEVLAIFAQAGDFLTPDELQTRLPSRPERRSLYTYLLRLTRQGLLERGPDRRRGHLTYRLTARGYARLQYLHQLR